MAGFRYSPFPAPLSQIIPDIVRWADREFAKLRDHLTQLEVDTVNFGLEVQTTAAAGVATVNWTKGPMQRVLYGAAVTISFVQPDGVCEGVLVLERTAAGAYSPTLPSTVKWAGGTIPTWSSTSGAKDVLRLYYDGANYHGTVSLNSS